MFDEYGDELPLERLPGRRVFAGESPEPLLFRSVNDEERQLGLGGHQGRSPVRRRGPGRRRGERERGRDRGQGGRARPAPAGRGQPDARHVARLREDPAGGGPAGGARLRRLVRRRSRRPGRRGRAGGDSPRRPRDGRAGRPHARALPARPRGPQRPGDGAGHWRDRLLAGDPRRAAGGERAGRGAPRAAAVGRPALRGDRAAALRRQGDRRDTFVLTDRTFSEADIRLGEELASRAVTAIENSRLFTERGRIARTLQEGLLPPSLEAPPGWETAVLFRAAGSANEVGGLLRHDPARRLVAVVRRRRGGQGGARRRADRAGALHDDLGGSAHREC